MLYGNTRLEQYRRSVKLWNFSTNPMNKAGELVEIRVSRIVGLETVRTSEGDVQGGEVQLR